MLSYKEIVKILKEEGEFNSEQTFYVFGNLQANKILLFEKFDIFFKFIQLTGVEYTYPDEFYSIYSFGIPSKSCLQYLKKFKNKQIFYFGDLDPLSLFTCLTFVFGNRKFGKNSKKKFNVKFAGLTPEDYNKFLSKKDVKIKIMENELKILEFLKQLRVKEISDEVKFLSKGYKVELEALNLMGFDKYFKSKIKLLKEKKIKH